MVQNVEGELMMDDMEIHFSSNMLNHQNEDIFS
jgi:hypothetical protein